MPGPLKTLVETLVRGLVQDPSQASVEEWTEEGVVHFDVVVSERDRGRVIGRQGRTADALRDVIEAVGRRRGVECDLEIMD